MRFLFCLIVLTFVVNVFAQAPCEIHGCFFANATEGVTTITFPGRDYLPKCIRVATGTTVTFSGTFISHPLISGYYDGAKTTPFAGSITDTTQGVNTNVAFKMTVEGSNPYYCDYHYEGGMVGVIYVGDSCGATSGPLSNTPSGNPIANPVAPTSATPLKTSSAVTVSFGFLSLLAVFAF